MGGINTNPDTSTPSSSGNDVKSPAADNAVKSLSSTDTGILKK